MHAFYFWNINELENQILISNFTKNIDFRQISKKKKKKKKKKVGTSFKNKTFNLEKKIFNLENEKTPPKLLSYHDFHAILAF